MTPHWLYAHIYYAPASVNDRIDSHADQLLTDVIGPLHAELAASGAIDWGWFFRFSEQGYHLRFNLSGPVERLRAEAEPLIRARCAAAFAANPALAQGSTVGHGVLIERLNERRGITAYHPAGTVNILVLPEEQLGHDYEDLAAFNAFGQLQDQCSRASVALLRQGLDTRQRKTLVRLLMADMLRLTGMDARELYLFLVRLQREWMGYFDLATLDCSSYAALYARNAPSYEAFFGGHTALDASLNALAPALRPIYAEWHAAFAASLPALMRRDAAGALTMQALQRLITLFHLNHNRLGVNLLDETYLAYVLAQFYGARLDEADREAIDAELGPQFLDHYEVSR